MRKELVCPRCGHAVFWHIRHVPEHASGASEQALAVSLQRPAAAPWWNVAHWFDEPVATGWFELLVCEGCNHVEWYARGIDGAGMATEAFACPACGGGEAWLVPKLRERTGDLTTPIKPLPVLASGLGNDGHYALAVCRGCGFTEFSAREVQWVTEHRFGVTVDKTACRCGAPERLRIAVAEESAAGGVRPLHLSRAAGFWPMEDVGQLSPAICRRCGATEWRAEAIDRLREDVARGVARINGKERMVESQGPYR